jgi:hypothetical protein
MPVLVGAESQLIEQWGRRGRNSQLANYPEYFSHKKS